MRALKLLPVLALLAPACGAVEVRLPSPVERSGQAPAATELREPVVLPVLPPAPEALSGGVAAEVPTAVAVPAAQARLAQASAQAGTIVQAVSTGRGEQAQIAASHDFDAAARRDSEPPAVAAAPAARRVGALRKAVSRGLTKAAAVAAPLALFQADAGFQLPEPPQWMPWIGGALSGLSLWGSMHAANLKRLIKDTPISKAAGVFIGFVEVQGTAETDRPLVTALTETSSVYYTWSVQERWTRTYIVMVDDYEDDGKGNRRKVGSHPETRTETGWTTVADGGEQKPFYLKDETGLVRVDPEDAKIEPLSTLSREVTPGDPLYYGKGPSSSVMHSDHIRLFTEEAIPLHTPLFVAGHARLRKDVIAPEIGYQKGERMFLITTESKDEVGSGYTWQTAGLWVLGLLLSLAGVIVKGLMLDMQWPDVVLVQQAPLIIAGASFIGATLLGYAWMAYNSMASLTNDVSRAWSEIDVQLQRRHDLIPNLVAAAQGLAQHEAEVQSTIAFLRGQQSVTAPGLPGLDPQAVSGPIRVLAQKYPSLVSSPAFLEVEKGISETEQRIALARTYYNDIVANYNIRLQQIPNRWIARLGGHKPRKMFEANGFERASVDVKLA